MSTAVEASPMPLITTDVVGEVAALVALSATASVVELRLALASVERIRCWVDAQAAIVSAALIASGEAGAVNDACRDARLSSFESRLRRAAATGVGAAPVFGAAMANGVVGAEHAAAVGRVRNKAALADAQHGLLAQAADLTPDEFAKRVRAWDDALDAANGVDPSERRRRKRSLSFHVGDDGMGVGHWVLPALEHEQLEATIRQKADALWRSGQRDDTNPQRLADALVDAVLGGTNTGCHSCDGGRSDTSAGDGTASACTAGDGNANDGKPTRPAASTLFVTIDVNQLIDGLEGHGVATTINGTPLSAGELRRLACTAGIIPIVLDGQSRILDVGYMHRYATEAQWLALIARDKGCVIEGCISPIHACDAHHCWPWENGGPTNMDNLALLCRMHHQETHERNWTVNVEPKTHRVSITDANGKRIRTRAPV